MFSRKRNRSPSPVLYDTSDYDDDSYSIGSSTGSDVEGDEEDEEDDEEEEYDRFFPEDDYEDAENEEAEDDDDEEMGDLVDEEEEEEEAEREKQRNDRNDVIDAFKHNRNSNNKRIRSSMNNSNNRYAKKGKLNSNNNSKWGCSETRVLDEEDDDDSDNEDSRKKRPFHARIITTRETERKLIQRYYEIQLNRVTNSNSQSNVQFVIRSEYGRVNTRRPMKSEKWYRENQLTAAISEFKRKFSSAASGLSWMDFCRENKDVSSIEYHICKADPSLRKKGVYTPKPQDVSKIITKSTGSGTKSTSIVTGSTLPYRSVVYSDFADRSGGFHVPPGTHFRKRIIECAKRWSRHRPMPALASFILTGPTPHDEFQKNCVELITTYPEKIVITRALTWIQRCQGADKILSYESYLLQTVAHVYAIVKRNDQHEYLVQLQPCGKSSPSMQLKWKKMSDICFKNQLFNDGSSNQTTASAVPATSASQSSQPYKCDFNCPNCTQCENFSNTNSVLDSMARLMSHKTRYKINREGLYKVYWFGGEEYTVETRLNLKLAITLSGIGDDISPIPEYDEENDNRKQSDTLTFDNEDSDDNNASKEAIFVDLTLESDNERESGDEEVDQTTNQTTRLSPALDWGGDDEVSRSNSPLNERIEQQQQQQQLQQEVVQTAETEGKEETSVQLQQEQQQQQQQQQSVISVKVELFDSSINEYKCSIRVDIIVVVTSNKDPSMVSGEDIIEYIQDYVTRELGSIDAEVTSVKLLNSSDSSSSSGGGGGDGGVGHSVNQKCLQEGPMVEIESDQFYSINNQSLFRAFVTDLLDVMPTQPPTTTTATTTTTLTMNNTVQVKHEYSSGDEEDEDKKDKKHILLNPKAKYIQWTTENVRNWILTLDPEFSKLEYDKLFEKHKIDGRELMELTNSNLKDMGILPLRDRKLILRQRDLLLSL